MPGVYRSKAADFIEQLLNYADVTINGRRPWDIQVSDTRFYERVVSQGSLGLGEAYMEAWWNCEAVDTFIYKTLTADLHLKIKGNKWQLAVLAAIAVFFNMQNKRLAQRVAQAHYDIDNGLYQDMLGESMSYTCAYWKNAQTLDEAQHNKHELVCQKLNLQPGDKVLELGCGWGSFAKYAASNYGCEMVSVNISREQVKYAKEICKDLSVNLYQCDYRDVETYNPNNIKFDKVVSIGMCEHVGYKNYKTLMQIAASNLKDHGLFLLHTIGGNKFSTHCEPWTDKYIFPGGVLPSISGLGTAMENIFVMEDWHNFGCDYDKTLMAWHENFLKHWDTLKQRYDEKFFRMWNYYLLSCAGMFRARQAQLWQIVLSKGGLPGGYQSVR